MTEWDNHGWTVYRIFGLAPEVPEGHLFNSAVPDLDQHPELWEAECPYIIGHKATPRVVKEEVPAVHVIALTVGPPEAVTGREAGITAIVALQALAGITEPRERAAIEWDAFSPIERAATLVIYHAMCRTKES